MSVVKNINLNQNQFYFTIVSIITFFSVETIARMYDFYTIYPMYDLLSHFLFGCGFYSILILFRYIKFNQFKKSLKYYFIIALIWELLEIIGDKILITSDSMRDFFFWNGFNDIILGLIGLYYCYYQLKKLK